MNSDEPVTLVRDVEAAIIPVGERVTLKQGEQAQITQTLGGSYTVIVNGNICVMPSSGPITWTMP